MKCGGMGGVALVGTTVYIQREYVFHSLARVYENNGGYVYVGDYEKVELGGLNSIVWLKIDVWMQTHSLISESPM